VADRLPSLTSLRAFEAAARHLSFTAAADELNVSHSAVSHQIKALEADIGVRLFHRHTRMVELTDAGQQYFAPVSQAFERLKMATDEVRAAAAAPSALTVQVYVTMAMRWFLPRLNTFQERYPDIEVQISTSYKDFEFNRRTVDAGFLYVRAREPGLYYRFLYEGWMFPVVSPASVERYGPLTKPADLIRYPLLSVYTAADDWAIYLQAAGVSQTPPLRKVSYDSYILALEAAVAGEGVAMAEMAFVRADLAAGRLIKPFDFAVRRPGDWYFACEVNRRDEPHIRRFEDWLVEQVGADADMNRAGLTEPTDRMVALL